MTAPVKPRLLSETYAQAQAKRAAQKNFPQMGAFFAVLAVALTVVIMAFSGLYGIVPILVFYAIWGSQAFYKGMQILKPSKDMLYAMLLPGFACLSMIWSDFRPQSLYGGVEFISMLVCVTIISRTVPTRSFIRGVGLGAMLVLLITLADGGFGRDEMGGGYALVGALGSKNQVGFFAEIGILASLVIFFSRARRLEKFFFSFCVFIVSAWSLYLSHSGTSVVSLAVAVGVIIMAYMVTRFPGRFRMVACGAAVVLAFAFAGIGMTLGWDSAALQGMGKDSTLTGRTYLWSQGMKIGMDNPVLGHGYGAFWVQGQPLAEKFWYEFDVGSRMGFHFHNLFVEVFVELGAVGVLLVAWLVLTNAIRSFRSVLRDGMQQDLVFLMGIAFTFLIRTFAEVDFMGPFGIGPLLFFSVFLRLVYQRQEQQHKDTNNA